MRGKVINNVLQAMILMMINGVYGGGAFVFFLFSLLYNHAHVSMRSLFIGYFRRSFSPLFLPTPPLSLSLSPFVYFYRLATGCLEF